MEKYKQFKTFYKATKSCQCKFCEHFFPVSIFQTHVASCEKGMEAYSVPQFFQMPLSCKVTFGGLDQSSQNTQYKVIVDFNREKQWCVTRTYTEFRKLHESLIFKYVGVRFPQASSIFQIKVMPHSAHIGDINDRIVQLDKYISELILTPAIRMSNKMQEFLGFKDHYTEFYNFEEDPSDGHPGDGANHGPTKSIPESLREFVRNPDNSDMQPKPPVKKELLKFIQGTPQ